jgi:hypothetical protein
MIAKIIIAVIALISGYLIGTVWGYIKGLRDRNKITETMSLRVFRLRKHLENKHKYKFADIEKIINEPEILTTGDK